ncbi:hypothetical protein [Acinetobacter bereziniae]|nr:hypothetical protein [Acinetobacter bereziniae]
MTDSAAVFLLDFYKKQHRSAADNEQAGLDRPILNIPTLCFG